MKTAVIYARYSSERQTEQSIEGQLRVCNDYAERNDIVIVDTYIDRAMTGTNDRRTDFQRMLKDSSKKAWDYVLVYKLDRFGRNKYEVATNKHTLKLNGVKLVSATENIPDTPEGIILESLLEGMAEYYSAELSQKVKRGMNESRRKGNFTGGYMLYGYKKEGKKLVIDEDKAEIVRFIYTRYAQNVYIKQIIEELNQKGILNRGKPFAINTVHHILQNEKYSGVYHYADETFTNLYPQIVPEDLFLAVQEKNKKNKYGSRSPFVVYLLHKKIVCGYCGNKINGVTGTSQSGDVKRYYCCSGKYLKKRCNKKNVRKDDLEKIVVKAIMKVFQNENTIDSFSDKIIRLNRKRMDDQSILNILVKEQALTLKAKNNILSAIEMGVVTPSTKERLLELENKFTELQEKIIQEKNKEKMLIDKDDITSYIHKALSCNADRIVDLLVKQIILYDDKIIITCKYSNKKGSQTENSDTTVYSSTVNFPVVKGNQYTQEMQKIKVEINI